MKPFLPETVIAADEHIARLIEQKIAAGVRKGQAQMDATYEVTQMLLEWRALGADI